LGWKVLLSWAAVKAALVEAALVVTILLKGFGLMTILFQQDESRQELDSVRVVPHESASVETIRVATESTLSVFPMLSPSFSCQIKLLKFQELASSISSPGSSGSSLHQLCFSTLQEVNPSSTFTASGCYTVAELKSTIEVRAIRVAAATLGIHKQEVAGSFKRSRAYSIAAVKSKDRSLGMDHT